MRWIVVWFYGQCLVFACYGASGGGSLGLAEGRGGARSSKRTTAKRTTKNQKIACFVVRGRTQVADTSPLMGYAKIDVIAGTWTRLPAGRRTPNILTREAYNLVQFAPLLLRAFNIVAGTWTFLYVSLSLSLSVSLSLSLSLSLSTSIYLSLSLCLSLSPRRGRWR